MDSIYFVYLYSTFLPRFALKAAYNQLYRCSYLSSTYCSIQLSVRTCGKDSFLDTFC